MSAEDDKPPIREIIEEVWNEGSSAAVDRRLGAVALVDHAPLPGQGSRTTRRPTPPFATPSSIGLAGAALVAGTAAGVAELNRLPRRPTGEGRGKEVSALSKEMRANPQGAGARWRGRSRVTADSLRALARRARGAYDMPGVVRAEGGRFAPDADVWRERVEATRALARAAEEAADELERQGPPSEPLLRQRSAGLAQR